MQFQLLDLLRNFDADAVTLDVMVMLAATGKNARAEYESRGLDVPNWLSDSLNRLSREIAARNRDELERKLAEARARKAQLLSRDERRAEADAEVARLEKLLAPTPVPGA